jgi:hypothetical protein
VEEPDDVVLRNDFRCNLPSGFIAKVSDNWGRPACSGGGRDVTWSAPIEPMSMARELFGCAAVPPSLAPSVERGISSAPRVLVCGGFTEESERIDGAVGIGGDSGRTTAHCEIYYPFSNHWHTFVSHDE